MANSKFKFNILTGETAPEKYAAISPKDPFTFYLLETGIGYLGEKKLFDSNGVDTIDTINPDNPTSSIPTEAAIVNYVIEVIRDKVPYEIDGVPGTSPSGSSSGTSKGEKGDPGVTFIPSVSTEGVLSWTNNGGLVNPNPVNIKGSKGDKGDTFLDTYSSNEVRIGTWIDGKPLYRKCFIITTPSNQNTWVLFPSTKIDNIGQITFIHGILNNSVGSMCATIPYYADNGAYVASIAYGKTETTLNSAGKEGLHMLICGSAFLNVTSYITIEYTKTTD